MKQSCRHLITAGKTIAAAVLTAVLLLFALSVSTVPNVEASPAAPPANLAQSALNAPSAITYSSLSWCFLNDVTTVNALSPNDTVQVTGTLTNNTGSTASFRIGVRLVTYNTSPLHDITFAGPTHLFGNGSTTSFKNVGVPAAMNDLNSMGAAAGNTDPRMAFGEVQNITPLANASATQFVVQLGIPRIDVTNVRVELYAYDVATNTLQTVNGTVSVPYLTTPTNCSATPTLANLGNSSSDLGSGILLLVGANGGPVTKNTEGWVNIDKPNYVVGDTTIVIEAAVTDQNYSYEHEGAYTIQIRLAGTATVVTTITLAGSTPCYSTTTILPVGTMEVLCRNQSYYVALLSPSPGGYGYTFGYTPTITQVIRLPIASNTWLIPGQKYEVRMLQDAGTGSHATATYVTDFFTYQGVPTALELSSVSAELKDKNSVLVRWETANELNLVGFNVWRKRGKGNWKPINDDLIAAKNPVSGAGASYEFLDTHLRPGKVHKYKVEVVRADGTKSKSEKVKVKVPKE